MKVTIKTLSGSVYVLNKTQMTWDRKRERPYDAEELKTLTNPVRTDGGTLARWPNIVEGQLLVLSCPPLVEGTAGRAIFTSSIIEIEETQS